MLALKSALSVLILVIFSVHNVECGQEDLSGLDSLNLAEEEHARLTRTLLAIEADPADPGFYINEKNCTFMYNNGIVATVKLYKEEKDSTYTLDGGYTFELEKNPTSRKAVCADETPGLAKTNASLQLSYSGTEVESVNVTSVTLNLVFEINNLRRKWSLSPSSAVEVDGPAPGVKRSFTLKESGVTASSGFSFSCLNLQLDSPSPTNNTLATISMVVKRFQFQPFSTKNPDKIFANSFDCSTWFTISLWVGLFTLLLFTSIIGGGVYMLFDIKTMDRFENPKGKTITVTAAD
ncbi:V-type proton ATPase subunit S1 [Halotydeus destructor]|nr:V-type proton ATPase subunit S1 [Halotydeus destructor]